MENKVATTLFGWRKHPLTIRSMLSLTVACAGICCALRYWCDTKEIADRRARHFFLYDTIGVVEKSEIDDAWDFATAKNGFGSLIYIEECSSVRNSLGGRRFYCAIQLPSVVKQDDVFHLKSAPESTGGVGEIRVLSPQEEILSNLVF